MDIVFGRGVLSYFGPSSKVTPRERRWDLRRDNSAGRSVGGLLMLLKTGRYMLESV